MLGRGPDDYERARAAHLDVFDVNIGVLNHVIGMSDRAFKTAGQRIGRRWGLHFDGPNAGALQLALAAGSDRTKDRQHRVPTRHCDLFERWAGSIAAYPWRLIGSVLSVITGTASLIVVAGAVTLGVAVGLVLGTRTRAIEPAVRFIAEMKVASEHRLVHNKLKHGHFIYRALAHGSAARQIGELVGLQSVKDLISDTVGDPDMHPDFRGMNQRPGRHLNALFSGAPGTGKRTMALLYGRVLHDAGILAKGHTVVATPGDLFDRTLTGTQDRTRQMVELALDGVLYIPWAHHICDYPDDSARTAMTELAQAMRKHRGRLAVIFATYPQYRNARFALAPDLSRNITSRLDFPDYSDAELALILKKKAEQNGYEVEDDLSQAVGTLVGKGRGTVQFGNAGDVETALEHAVKRRDLRLMAARRLKTSGEQMASQRALLLADFLADHPTPATFTSTTASSEPSRLRRLT